MNRPTFPCDLRAALAAPSLDHPLHPALDGSALGDRGATLLAKEAPMSPRPFGRFEVEILDRTEFVRLNEELARIDELYEPEPGGDEEEWLALRGIALAALRRTFRHH